MLAQALGQPARPAGRRQEPLAPLTELPPHPGRAARPGALRGAGFRLATLTNSPGPHPARAAGLRRPDRLLRAGPQH
ncbi:MAG: hypothetical protein WKG07_39145 [Hymenobacter sp.]